MNWCDICNGDLLRLLNFNRQWNLLRGKRRGNLRCGQFFRIKVLGLNLETRCFFYFNHGHLSLTTFPLTSESPSGIFTHPFMSFPIGIFFILDLRHFNHSLPKRRWNHLLRLWCPLRRQLDNHDDSHLAGYLIVPLPSPGVTLVLQQPFLSDLLCVCLVTQGLHGHLSDLTFH